MFRFFDFLGCLIVGIGILFFVVIIARIVEFSMKGS